MPTKRVDVTYDADTHIQTFAPVADGCDAAAIALDDVYPGAIAALAKTKNGAMAVHAFVHGNKQKGGDSYSAKDKVPDEVVGEAVTKVFESITDGNWSTKGIGEGVARVNDDLLGLMELYTVNGKETKTMDECKDWYGKLAPAPATGKGSVADLRLHKKFDLAKSKVRERRTAERNATKAKLAADAPALDF